MSESSPPARTDQSRTGAFVRIALTMLLMVVMGLTIYRIVKQYHAGGAWDVAHGGMADFHNGAYYPALAMRRGLSPYGAEFASTYPVARACPAYSPSIIALHIPFTFLSLPWADIVYGVFSCMIWGCVAWLILREYEERSRIDGPSARARRILGSSLWLILLLTVYASRPGHMTTLNGYFTPILVLGVQLALQYAHRYPLLAAVGIFLASGKPNFALPLGFVMLARGNYRALTMGVSLSLVGAILPAWWMASHSSWSDLLDTIRQGQSQHQADPNEFPVNTWTRVDVMAIFAKWTNQNPSEFVQLVCMLPLLVMPCWWIRKLAVRGDREGTQTVGGCLMLLTMVLVLYHQVYDTLILLSPVAFLLFQCLSKSSWSRLFFGEPSTGVKGLASHQGGSSAKQTMPIAREWNGLAGRSLLGSVLMVGLSMPWWNYTSTDSFLHRIEASELVHRCLTSLNGLSLMVGWMIVMMLAWRDSRPRAFQE